MNSRICVSLAAAKVSEIQQLIKQAESMEADFIEIRLDYLESINGIEKVAEETNVPLIATNRQYKQGGKRLQQERKRIETLLQIAKHGFSYVDVELTTPKIESVISELLENHVKPIVSFHHFETTPKIEKLRKIVHLQINMGAEICKLITTANKFDDNLSCLSIVSEMREKTKIICFAMGKHGLMSRIFSPLFGAYFTYASLKKGLETASGQLSIRNLKQIYKWVE